MKQRITSLLLCLVMVLSMCTFLSFGSAAEEATPPTAPESAVWDGTVATAYAGGDGSAENPYLIADATQFAYFAAQVNAGVDADKCYKLVADIWCNDLSNFANWLTVDTTAVSMSYKAPANQIQRIGQSSSTPFMGTFDGDGYTIYGASYGANYQTASGSIFYYVSGATIKNLNVEYAAFSTTGSSGGHVVAGLIANVTGKNLTTTIENCRVSNSVLAASRKEAGGMIGSVGGNAVLKMTNCSVENTTVLAGGQAGGLIGASSGSYIYLTDCSVAGTVVAKGNAGGLVGSHTQNAMIRFSKCKNYASVTSTTGYAAGFMTTSTNHSSGNRGDYFYNCANYGAVTGATRAGGIVGEFSQSNGVCLYIYNCYNEGAVKATAEGGYAGGFIGYVNCGTTGNAAATNLELYGSVNMGTVEGSIKGGLIAFATYTGSKPTNINGEMNYCEGAAVDATTDASLVANLSYAAIPSDLAALNEALNSYNEGKVYEVTDNQVVTMSATPTKWTLGVTTEYTIIFVDANGVEISRETVIAGNAVTAIPTVEAEEGFEFDTWVDVETGKEVNLEEVSDNATVKPAFKAAGPYIVTFLGRDGSLLKTEVVAWGAAATAPEAPEVESYEFSGWSVAFDSVKSDLTVTAQYTFTGTYFAGGYGTEEEPFLLETAQNLVDLSARVAEDVEGTFIAGHYKMIADIDLAGIKWEPIADFSGVFDGNGKTISNMQRVENAELAFFRKATGTIKDLTFTNARFGQSTSNGGNRAVIAITAYGELLIENCHVKDSEIRLNGTGALMVVSVANDATVTFKNCTAAGEIKASKHAYSGGFVGYVGAAHVYFYDCTSFAVIVQDNNGVLGSAKASSGFVASLYTNYSNATFENCVFAGELYSDGQAGAFVAFKNALGTAEINNCSAYGTIRSKNNHAGGLIGAVHGYGTLKVNNCISYATVGSDTKYAGGILGYIDGGNAAFYIENVISLSTVSCGNVETGAAGDIIGGIYQGTGASYVKNAYALTNNFVAFENQTKTTALEMFVLESTTALPEGLKDNAAWEIGATFDIAGISVTLGYNMGINVLAKTGIVLKANAGKLYVDGLYITAGDKVTIDGVDYVKFIYDGFKVADMDKVLALSLICGTHTQKEYVITDYIVNIYGAEDGKYQALLDAMLYYGDAAQKAKYGTSTVLASASLKLEKEFNLNMEELFIAANLKTHAGLNAVGMALDLSSNVIPVFMVGEGVEKVYVTIYDVTAEITVVDGKAYFYGLNATSLNNLMTVSYTAADGTEVSFDTNVAMYIETALATEDLLTEDEANLAKALAVYMRAARTFKGLE